MNDQPPLDRVASHALNSDLEDMTPAASGNSTPLSDYSPHSQPFAERPENRTMAGVAARQTLSSLPSPPPFTPAAGQQSNMSPQGSAAGSNNKQPAWSPAAPGDTPGVTSAWQPASANASPGSSSVTFAFTPVAAGEAASPDAQPFKNAEQAGAGQQKPPAGGSVPKAADIVRAAERRLATSHDSDARSDASGSVASASTSTRSFSSGLPAGSPGDILRAATSKLSAQHAISGSSRIRDPQRRKSGALKTPMHQKVAHAPTPNSTPLQESDMRRSDDLAGHNDDTADSGTSAGASPATATSAGAAAAAASPAAQTPGSLKVQVKMGSPPAASPSKSTKSPGSRSSVVSIGSVCGAAGPAFTPLHAAAPGDPESLQAGKYTPTMKLDFGATPGPTPAVSVFAIDTPGSTMSGRVAGSISPALSFDVGEVVTPARSAAGTPVQLPDDLTGLVDKLQFSGNKAVLREAWRADDADAAQRQDQLQAALQDADEDLVAALGITPGAADGAAAAAAAAGVGAGTSSGWWGRGRSTLLLVLAAMVILASTLVAVQFLPPTALLPGAACTAENTAACSAALQAQLRAAEKETSQWQLLPMRAKWYIQDAAALFWYGRLPAEYALERGSTAWMNVITPKQLQRMTHDQAIKLFADVPEHLLKPEFSDKLAAARTHQDELEKAAAAQEAAARAAAEEARIAAEKAEAERVAKVKAEAERKAKEEAERAAKAKAEAERKAQEEAERLAKEKAEAERLAALRAAEEARIAAEKAEAERLAREKAEAERVAAEKAAAARRAAEKAAAEKAEQLVRERARAERLAAAKAEAERLAAEKAAEDARLAAVAAEEQQLAAERALQAEREAAERAAAEQTEREAAALAAGDCWPEAAASVEAAPADADALPRSWLPLVALLALLLSVGAGGGYVWHSQQQAGLAARQQHLDDIRTIPDDTDYQAGVEDEDEQQQDALAAKSPIVSAAAVVAGATGAAASSMAAGVQQAASSIAARVMTPRSRPPLPPGVEHHEDGEGLEDDQEAAAAPARGRGRPRSSKAAAAAAADGATTPRSTVRRGRGSAAAGGADSGVESDAAATNGKARAARGRKAAATPGRVLEPLLEDAPAEPVDNAAAEAAADTDAEEAPAAGRKGGRRASAPAASRRRTSAAATAAAAAAEPAAAEATTPVARRSTRAARTPRV